MTTPLIIFGAVLIIIGVAWWCLEGVSAERPASLLVGVGAGICIYAAFGPYRLGVAIGAFILFVLLMMVTQTRGGGERGRSER